jgi:hypothetical protein
MSENNQIRPEFDASAGALLMQVVSSARQVASCVPDPVSITMVYPRGKVHIGTAGDPVVAEALATDIVPLGTAIAAFLTAGLNRTPGGLQALQYVGAGLGTIEVRVDLLFESITATFIGKHGQVLLFTLQAPMEAN